VVIRTVGEELLDPARLMADFERDLADADSTDALRRLRNRYSGKKSVLAAARAGLGALPAEQRPEQGRKIQRLREQLDERIEAALAHQQERELKQRLAVEWADLSMPGVAHDRGAIHSLSQVIRQCAAVLRQFGFEHVDGPEVVTAFHNFDALNMDEHHPARDMQDTFWLTDNLLLRAHNTTVQAAVLEQCPTPPVKIMSAGRAYRNETVDATHTAMFHQFEGVWLEPGISFADLKGLLLMLARGIYGEGEVFRFKPKYYPYTEPSIGMDIRCSLCAGRGCAGCHDVGWVTILGAGMIHPRVLQRFGYDPDEVGGLAFGLGLSRMVIQLFGLSAMKPLYENDLRVHESVWSGGL
jgi:phenylalanyl-tRNA synthetase alpha chain